MDQKKIEAYLIDFNKECEKEDSRASCFWSYVAGREHGKEIYPGPVPVKAQWVRNEKQV